MKGSAFSRALLALSGVALLASCTRESDSAKDELNLISAAQGNSSLGREADNARLCAAHIKLQNAYLKEGNQQQYQREQLSIAAYC